MSRILVALALASLFLGGPALATARYAGTYSVKGFGSGTFTANIHRSQGKGSFHVPGVGRVPVTVNDNGKIRSTTSVKVTGTVTKGKVSGTISGKSPYGGRASGSFSGKRK
ncbi:MAG: hypothetical protein KDK07_07925 [Bauldia sp.]|nr:hypothetical protein [Bauldia sp.]